MLFLTKTSQRHIPLKLGSYNVMCLLYFETRCVHGDYIYIYIYIYNVSRRIL